MIRRCSVQFCSELGSSSVFQLIRVHAQAESMRSRGLEDAARVVDRKHVRFAEHVAECGELRGSRQHFMNDHIEIIGAAATEFIGDLVCAEERWYGANRRDTADGAKQFQFVIERKAVARFCLDGGGAVAQEPIDVARGGVVEIGIAGGSCLSNRGANSAARRGDFLIGRAFGSHFEFIGAITGEYGMRVCIDEARHDYAAACVDNFRVVIDLHFRACADRCDAAIANHHRPIVKDVQLAQFTANSRPGGTRERDKL